MADKPDKKTWSWRTWAWIVVSAILLYPLSLIPVVLTLAWLVEWKLLPQEPAQHALETVYAPIVWLSENPTVSRALSTVLEPLTPLFPRPR